MIRRINGNLTILVYDSDKIIVKRSYGVNLIHNQEFWIVGLDANG